jgi:hypothetical protein
LYNLFFKVTLQQYYLQLKIFNMTLTEQQLKVVARNQGSIVMFLSKEEKQREFDILDAHVRITVASNERLINEGQKMLQNGQVSSR